MRVFFATILVVALSLEVAGYRMKSKTTGSGHSTAIVADQSMTASVTSKDGTTIGYRQIGYGPGLVILHGTAESSHSHMELAQALADTYTIYLPDRRGRGLSGTYGVGYGVTKEVEDLDAILTKTGAHYVFGVSVGAIVSLHAARTLPSIQKLAIFEPPFILNGSPSTAFLARYDGEIAEGNVPAALVTAMKGSEMGPAFFRAMPHWLMAPLTKRMIAREDRNAKAGDVTMRMLAPTLHYDFQLICESEGPLDRFKDIRADLLLLGGTKSPSYFQTSVETLSKVFPRARRITLRGLGHEASGNANQWGKPEQVARELRGFF
jgi:pimeloyl-ACP methyl ester carboxylesterase